MSYRSIFRDDLFVDQTIIVTGGGSGIGRAIAHELASLGAHVVISGRKAEKLETVRDEIRAAGGSVSFYTCNIRDEDEVEALIRQTIQARGAIHGLVNNAGGQFPSPAEFISKKGWHAVVETNMTGTFQMCQQAFNHYMREHGGAIVNIVAEMWRGFPGMAHTGAARAGVVNFTKTLAVEWAHAGVRINAVAPGVIAGSGLQQYDEAAQPFIELAKKDLPFRRLGTESEVAAAVVFLLTPAAAYISGETLRVDGASSLWRKTWIIEDHENAPTPYDGFEEDV